MKKNQLGICEEITKNGEHVKTPFFLTNNFVTKRLAIPTKLYNKFLKYKRREQLKDSSNKITFINYIINLMEKDLTKKRNCQ